MGMKQPETGVQVWEVDDISWQVDLSEKRGGMFGADGACIGAGASKQSAIRAARKRLKNLDKELAKMAETCNGDG